MTNTTLGGVSAARETWNAVAPIGARIDFAKSRRVQFIAVVVSQTPVGYVGEGLSCVRFAGFLLAACASASAGGDAVVALDRKLASGEVQLRFDPRWGYLPALLEELDIPRSSQLLVFSKTSAQFRWITPRNPRAIYFNDETYVGWVPGASLLEISTATPEGGAAFYTLAQRRAIAPRLVADDGSCLQCHESHRTLGVPGHLTRSVYPAADGLPHFRHGTVNVDHTTPIAERWGGWFVTGRIGMAHRGNAVGPDGRFNEFATGLLARSPERFFDPTKYLTPHSDVIAHLVLAHQARVHNAIAKAAVEAREAIRYQHEMERLFGEPSESVLASVERRIERPAEALVRDLLLEGEAPLVGDFGGDSGFAEEFQGRGNRHSSGRSLRDLDLKSRLFRYPCSYLIESRAYKQLPERVLKYVEDRIAAILAGRDQSGSFGQLDVADRDALKELLPVPLSYE